jgi:hypothetical protein
VGKPLSNERRGNQRDPRRRPSCCCAPDAESGARSSRRTRQNPRTGNWPETGDKLEFTMTKTLLPRRPKPAVLEKVKHHFLGFRHFQREIHAKRKPLASRLELSVRTLDRYLHHLAEIGWMETTRRTPRTAFRTVIAPAPGASVGGSPGESLGGSQKRESQKRKSLKEELEGKPPKQHHQRDDADGSPKNRKSWNSLACGKPSRT